MLITEPQGNHWACDLAKAFTRTGATVQKLILQPSGWEERWHVFKKGYLPLSAEEPIAKRIRDEVNAFRPQIMLYLDPKTGEILREWQNPYTGETVSVIHVANDPVNSRGPNFGYGRDGKVAKLPIEEVGNYWQMNLEIPLFYHNVLAGNYQKYVGGTYHATELFNFYGPLDELLDENLTSIDPGVSWVRIAQWLPWMEMNGRDGFMYFNAQGSKLKSWDDLPAVLKDEIAASYPEYRHAPPGDDNRPNETSWTVFKKALDARATESPAAKAGH